MTVYMMDITPLTPIFIGSGDELLPYEYCFTVDSTVLKMNMAYVMSLMDEKDKQDFQNSFENMVKIRSFFIEMFKKALKQNKEFAVEYSIKAGKSAHDLYKDKINDIKNALELRTFIRHPADRKRNIGAYIPGSSIKGALKGAWLQQKFEEQKFFIKYEHQKKGRVPSIMVNYNESNLPREKNVSAFLLDIKPSDSSRGITPDDVCAKDPFKAIKVGDSNTGLKTYVCRFYGLQYKNKENQLKSMSAVDHNFEVLPHHEILQQKQIEARFIIDETLQNVQGLKQKIELNDLINAANTLSEKIIQEDLEFFNTRGKQIQDDKIDSYCSSAYAVSQQILNEIKNAKETQNTCILRVGFHSGFNAMSFNVASEPAKRLKTKTRTIADEKYPLGWIKITFRKP